MNIKTNNCGLDALCFFESKPQIVNKIESYFNQLSKYPLNERYDILMDCFKNMGIPDEYIQYFEYCDCELRTQLMVELENKLNDKGYAKWLNSVDQKRKEDVYNDLADKLTLEAILKCGGFIEYGDTIYDYLSYFACQVYKFGAKYTIVLSKKYHNGVWYNPYYSEKHCGVTIKKANELIREAAKYMINIGRYEPTLKDYSDKFNSL